MANICLPWELLKCPSRCLAAIYPGLWTFMISPLANSDSCFEATFAFTWVEIMVSNWIVCALKNPLVSVIISKSFSGQRSRVQCWKHSRKPCVAVYSRMLDHSAQLAGPAAAGLRRRWPMIDGDPRVPSVYPILDISICICTTRLSRNRCCLILFLDNTFF